LRCSPLVAAVTLALTVPSALLAQTPGSASASAEQPPAAALGEVHVVLVGPTPAPEFSARLQSLFGAETRVSVAATYAIKPDEVLGPKQAPGVHVWITTPSRSNARLYFVVVDASAPEQRFLMRDVELGEGLDELGLERVAQVVHASAQALWQGQSESPRAELERELYQVQAAAGAPPSAATPAEPAAQVGAVQPEAAPPPTEPVASPSSDEAPPTEPSREPDLTDLGPADGASSAQYEVALGYGATTRGAEGVAHGPELALMVLGDVGPAALGGFLSARYLFPVHPKAAELDLRVTGAGLRGGLVLHHELAPIAAVEAAAYLGADVIRYSAKSSETVEAGPSERETRPLVGAQLGIRIPARGWGFALAATVDVPLQKTHYDIVRDAGPEEVLTPSRVQLGLALTGRWGSE
jgi:hypothetical protein